MKRAEIKGPIIPNGNKWIYDFFKMEATCPNDIAKVLNEANGDDVEIMINSPGGDVWSGQQIYTNIRDYSGKVLIKIQSMAASAAAVIAMAAESEISPVAQLMIHNVNGGAHGDHRDLGHGADVLRNSDEALANAFALKTGKARNEILDMMGRETWMTAQQAVEGGFVDRIMFEDKLNQDPVRLANSLGGALLPQSVIDFARKNLKNKAPADGKLNLQMALLELEERK